MSPSFAAFLRPLLRAGSAVACVLLAACAVGPNYRRPDLTPPPSFAEAPPQGESPLLSSHWWSMFGDEQLDQLAGQVLEANLDIRVALARVDQARAETRGARGSFFPAIELSPSVRRSRTPRSGAANGGTATGSGGAVVTTYNLPADVSYELDIWGKLRRQYESAHSLESASRADYAVVVQTALADLAQGYFALRFYDREVEIYQNALTLYQKQLDLTQAKQKAGLALQTDVLEAQNQIDTAQNQLLEVQRQRAKQEHALALLTGRPPAGFSVRAQTARISIPVVPPGLPASLLSRRPDVAEAEHRLISANALVGVAKANFYPSLDLTGSLGYESVDLNTLTNWENRVWSVGAGLTAPIFEGGRLTAAYQGAKASYDEAEANYRSAVLGAYRDVEDELSDLHLLAREADSLEQTLQSARENFRLTELQYRQGLNSYLQVITANQTLLTTELNVARAHNERLGATVLLIKGLGGGWDARDLKEK